MISLLRNPVSNPSYKRGLRLTGAMLGLYGLTFAFALFELFTPKFIGILKLICLGLAAFLALRAMSERRVLREQSSTYVSMLDKSVLPFKWQISSLIVGGLFAIFTYRVLGSEFPQLLVHAFAAGVLIVLSAAYFNAAKNFVDDSR
jgi:disulfide bond formation protein DsbB